MNKWNMEYVGFASSIEHFLLGKLKVAKQWFFRDLL